MLGGYHLTNQIDRPFLYSIPDLVSAFALHSLTLHCSLPRVNLAFSSAAKTMMTVIFVLISNWSLKATSPSSRLTIELSTLSITRNSRSSIRKVACRTQANGCSMLNQRLAIRIKARTSSFALHLMLSRNVLHFSFAAANVLCSWRILHKHCEPRNHIECAWNNLLHHRWFAVLCVYFAHVQGSMPTTASLQYSAPIGLLKSFARLLIFVQRSQTQALFVLQCSPRPQS
jgi:hypothetical protein